MDVGVDSVRGGGASDWMSPTQVGERTLRTAHRTPHSIPQHDAHRAAFRCHPAPSVRSSIHSPSRDATHLLTPLTLPCGPQSPAAARLLPLRLILRCLGRHRTFEPFVHGLRRGSLTIAVAMGVNLSNRANLPLFWGLSYNSHAHNGGAAVLRFVLPTHCLRRPAPPCRTPPCPALPYAALPRPALRRPALRRTAPKASEGVHPLHYAASVGDKKSVINQLKQYKGNPSLFTERMDSKVSGANSRQSPPPPFPTLCRLLALGGSCVGNMVCGGLGAVVVGLHR
jgi:hypothetical protein